MMPLHISFLRIVYVWNLWTMDSVLAWGKEGHEILANIAYQQLSTSTQTILQNILFPNDSYHKDDDPFSSPLAAVANWADTIRFTKEYAWTTPLHYVNIHDKWIPGGCPCPNSTMDKNRFRKVEEQIFENKKGKFSKDCTFVYERDCPKDHCAVGAILQFSKESSNPSSLWSDQVLSSSSFLRSSSSISNNLSTGIYNFTQREALMLLIHIVGDIHQPLHVSRQSDEGGNHIHVSFPYKFREYLDDRWGLMHSSWNLHSVWDVGIIEKAMGEYYNHSQSIFQQNVVDTYFTRENMDRWSNTCLDGINKDCVEQWAEESWEKAIMFAYTDELGNEIYNGTSLSEGYFETRLPVVMEQLALGGIRLASTLEHVVHQKSIVSIV